jgi:hypothetical protein
MTPSGEKLGNGILKNRKWEGAEGEKELLAKEVSISVCNSTQGWSF